MKDNQLGLIEIFKKDHSSVVPVAGGEGMKPPSMRTAVGMEDPEPDKRGSAIIPFAFIDAFHNNGPLRGRNDQSYEGLMERRLFNAFEALESGDLPGLDDVITKYGLDKSGEPVSERGLRRFMVDCYDHGLIRPQNWIQRVTQPIKYGIMRHRAKVAASR